MKVDLSKLSHLLFFVITLPAISIALGWYCAQLLPNAPFWVETLSPLTAYGLLYAFFEHTAWHWPLFRALSIVDAPDMRGRWEGHQHSSYKDANGKPTKSYVVLEVRQTFSNITAQTYYHRWTTNRSDSCFMDVGNQLYMVTLFESEPNVRHTGEEVVHKGTMRMKLAQDTGHLLGDYFNSRGNYGELELTRTGKALYNRFKI